MGRKLEEPGYKERKRKVTKVEEKERKLDKGNKKGEGGEKDIRGRDM